MVISLCLNNATCALGKYPYALNYQHTKKPGYLATSKEVLNKKFY